MIPGLSRVGRLARVGATTIAGFVAGAVVMAALQSPAVVRPTDSPSGPPRPEPVIRPEPPQTFLAWTPGGLPAGFKKGLNGIAGIRRAVVVKSGVAWLTRSYSAQGELVDRPPAGLAYPIEVAAVSPGDYAPFLPPAERGVVVPLSEGEGVLGVTGARLRGLDRGAVLEFGGVRVRVAAVLPDELVGAHELLVSRTTGAALGIHRDRYALVQPAPWIRPSLERRISRVLPAGTLLRVRAPGQTPYFRHGDAVLAPVRLKELFGEFAARPVGGGYLDVDPAWVRDNILTAKVPVLGRVTCHRALFHQLRGALRELVAAGLGDLVKPGQYAGCYSARFLNRIPSAGLSHHSWGIAIDINAADNPFGHAPQQDPRLVAIFERWGFNWGGRWLVPDGMHFEFRAFPAG